MDPRLEQRLGLLLFEVASPLELMKTPFSLEKTKDGVVALRKRLGDCLGLGFTKKGLLRITFYI